MSSGGGYKTKSSLEGSQTEVMKNMYEIFNHNLGQQLPAYPGSAGVTPFTPGQVQQDYQSLVGQPVQDMWQQNLLGLVGPDARGQAQQQFGMAQNQMSAQAGRVGEQSAYKEWLRTQPETGQAMQLGQAFLGTQPSFQYQVPDRSTPYANALLAGANAYGQYSMLSGMNQQSQQLGQGEQLWAANDGPWSPWG